MFVYNFFNNKGFNFCVFFLCWFPNNILTGSLQMWSRVFKCLWADIFSWHKNYQQCFQYFVHTGHTAPTRNILHLFVLCVNCYLPQSPRIVIYAPCRELRLHLFRISMLNKQLDFFVCWLVHLLTSIEAAGVHLMHQQSKKRLCKMANHK